MLPSIVQAYLGLRYVKQEQQRQEQLILRGMKSTLSITAKKIEENVEMAISHAFDSLISETSLSSNISPFELNRFLSGQKLLKKIFVIDHKGQLLYPRTFLPQNEKGTVYPVISDKSRPQLISGEEYEAQGNYNEALSKYSKGLDESKYTREKMAFLVRIARCYFKTGQLMKAEKTYRRVLTEDNNRFYGEEIPYQLVATFQLVRILDEKERSDEAFDILVDLYENMLQFFQHFTETQFLYYLAQIHEEIQQRLPKDSIATAERTIRLMEAEKIFMEEPLRADFLKYNLVPALEIALLTKSETNILRYTSFNNTNDSSKLLAYIDLGYLKKGIRIIGASLREIRLIRLVEGFITSADTSNNLHLELITGKNPWEKDVNPNTLLIAGEPLLLLSGQMQGYKIVFTGMEGTSLKKFTTKGVIPYYAIILVIILLIALGVIFIFQDISREQELTRMKSDFISNVTHEIKTPIATIRSLSENVNEGWVTSNEKQLDYFRLIARESERLGHLVENTLDFSRIESGSKRYNMEPGSLKEVIKRTVERFRLLSEGQDVKIRIAIDQDLPKINMDRVALGQAILNLLDNAAKYSTGEKMIRIHAFAEGDNVVFSVMDNGMGIERKDLSKIFNKFYRSETIPAGKITGSGIGLTLVKEIVEYHGGVISVDSTIREGSTFTICIPVNIEKRNDKNTID
jgi:signal transduction histidine kinase